MILNQLAPANPEVTFVIVGGASERAIVEGYASLVPANVRLLGAVSDAARNEAYAAADIAINPMFTGSGTNIKMLDFLAAGLPTISTLHGARGISNRNEACFIMDDISRFTIGSSGYDMTHGCVPGLPLKAASSQRRCTIGGTSLRSLGS